MVIRSVFYINSLSGSIFLFYPRNGEINVYNIKSRLIYPLTPFKQEPADYFDYYNHRRIKEKLKGMSPVDYRIHSLKAFAFTSGTGGRSPIQSICISTAFLTFRPSPCDKNGRIQNQRDPQHLPSPEMLPKKKHSSYYCNDGFYRR